MRDHMGGAGSGGGEDIGGLREVAAAHADAVSAGKKGEKNLRRRRSIRSVIAMLLATNTVLLGVLIRGAIGGPAPVVQVPVATPLVAAPVIEDVSAPEPVAVQEPPPRAEPRMGPGASSGGGGRAGSPAPSRGSRGGGRGGGVEDWYAPSGGLSDIFCRPRSGESQEEWIARVGNSCVR